jgi:hypothetical protein
VKKDRSYLCPKPFNEEGDIGYTYDELFSWTRDIITDGRAYLRLQPAYPFIQDGLDLVNGEMMKNSNVQTLSSVRTETTVRAAKELIAAQTNIRIIPAFKSEIGEFAGQTSILNKGFMAWQGMTFADRKLRKAWQYAVAAGTGYIGIRYDPNYYYKGKGDIVLDSYGPLDVLPVGMGRQHDIQKAYAVALRVETPVHEAWRLFPDYVDQLRPHKTSVDGKGTVIAQSVKFATAILKRFGQGRKYENEPATWEMLDVYYIYIDDDSVNDTGHPIQMKGPDGQYGTSWSYEVPYIGQEIPTGKANGSVTYRKASREDCLLYPNRRLVLCTDEIVLNPDPENQSSPYWHAKVPLDQFRADDWAWNFLGFPVTRYGVSLEKAGVELWRGAIDAMNCRLSPSRAYDRNNTSAALAAALNTRIPNQYVGLDLGLLGDNARPKPLLDYQWYEFPNHYVQVLSQIIPQIIKEQMGVADATALAKARQLPSGDSVEKLMEMMGPLIKDQSRNMEESIRGVGEKWKSNFFQFITAARRLSIMGYEGLSDEDYDYDPGTLIPDNLKAEEKDGPHLAVRQFERARWHKDNFSFSVTPYSLHELNSMTRKLFYLQLQKVGFPIDWWTLAELFDIKNFGPPPKFPDPITGELREATTVMERFAVQMEIKAREAQAMGGAQQKGRPPSGQQPPTLEQKGGVNSTVRESKH